MSSRKKNKKTKGQTLALTEFLGGVPTVPIKSTNWADDVEDEHDLGSYMSRSNKEPVVLPTAPRAARGPGVDEENIPTNPPYVAYISNLPYDVVESDLADFFEGMEVSNMRLPKDSTKLRGYGYVEFADRQSLIDALSMSNTMIKTRRVRIEVSNSSNDDRRGGGRMGMGRDNRRDGYDDPERTAGDWRSKPREESSGGDDRFRSRGGFDARERRGEDREIDNKPGGWREGERSAPAFSERRGFRGGDDDKRGGGFRDEERGGSSSFGDKRGYRDDDKRGFREGGEGRRGYRDDDGRRGGFRDDESSSSTWRSEPSAQPVADNPPSAEPRTRPKLNLQPRTKPIETIAVVEPKVEEEEVKQAEAEATPAPAPVPSANIFGAAKPVDTTAREREIEARLAKVSSEKANKSDDGENKAWPKRNGEGRGDREKEKPRSVWRSDQDSNRGRPVDRRQDPPRGNTSGRYEQRGDSQGNSKGHNSRSGNYRGDGKPTDSRRHFTERERRSKDREDNVPPMPKATDEETPNFVASNKYSMLPEDVDTDNIDN
ncbi:Similar to EIF4B: Eukaryotic translation initiation factor 4B (Homo sapiens) [Cotesia congregata]|uniref:Similar to EIF4B: Eukaryotic translation initiation factor 4B (Homo sapiens) n=1 Tax=Cotesia congregata TaxID=51543 RepID=A0A8J2MTS4_COTCN|nr:Similar to EIF4B: Eukaryotic translation initiation factor 4B (Homo sapiens) [Cotesia congregata]